MVYTDWNGLSMTLFQNGFELNKNLIMRVDIEKMDGLIVNMLLIDVLTMMTSETLKSQVNLGIPANCSNWEDMSLSLFLDDVLYGNIILNRAEFTSNLLESNDFLYGKFIELTGTVLN